jgi:hypothetical protein
MAAVRSMRDLRPAPLIVKRRRTFGLDAPRAQDPRRTERAVLAWLESAIPEIVPLRVACPEAAAGGKPVLSPDREGLAMALLLPRGQVALLQIAGGADRPGPRTLALLRDCHARRVPVAVIRTLDEARAALRRFGFEPRRT